MAKRIFFSGFMSASKFNKAGPGSISNLRQASKLANSMYFTINHHSNKPPNYSTKWCVDTEEKKLDVPLVENAFVVASNRPINDFLIRSLIDNESTIHDIASYALKIDDVHVETHEYHSPHISGKFFKGFGVATD